MRCRNIVYRRCETVCEQVNIDCSVGTNRLVVLISRLSTVGSRAFRSLAADLEWPLGGRDISRIIGHISSTLQDTPVQEVFSWPHTGHQLTVDLAVVPLLRPPKIVCLFGWLIDWLTAWVCECDRRVWVWDWEMKEHVRWYSLLMATTSQFTEKHSRWFPVSVYFTTTLRSN